jgi:hypothetical protein
MARFHARNGVLYVGATTSTAASPAAFITSFTIDAKSDRVDVTAFGDTSKVYVQGLADAQGTYAGFRDAAAKQLLAAAQDGLSRKWYFYEDSNTPTAYFFGTAFWDQSISLGVSAAAALSGTWASATPLGTSGIT